MRLISLGRDEVVAILRKYYEGLTEKVEIKLHGAATGDDKHKVYHPPKTA